MKIHCKTCGCHFDDDFEETLSDECGMWVERGFKDDMSVEHKRALFNTFFALPVDEIAQETGVVVSIDMRGTPGMTYSFNQFEAYVPGYGYMTDKEKRQLQKAMFKFSYNQDPEERIITQLRSMGVLRKLRNLEKKGQSNDARRNETANR